MTCIKFDEQIQLYIDNEGIDELINSLESLREGRDTHFHLSRGIDLQDIFEDVPDSDYINEFTVRKLDDV